MNDKDLAKFRSRLEDEKALLEKELDEIAKRDKSSAGGWDATSGNMEVDTADENEAADKLEEMEGNTGIASKLEDQLIEVNAALGRIEKGTYGICEKTGKPIELERLEANPSARFSIKNG